MASCLMFCTTFPSGYQRLLMYCPTKFHGVFFHCSQLIIHKTVFIRCYMFWSKRRLGCATGRAAAIPAGRSPIRFQTVVSFFKFTSSFHTHYGPGIYSTYRNRFESFSCGVEGDWGLRLTTSLPYLIRFSKKHGILDFHSPISLNGLVLY
jgi:hypothetical protein